MTNNRWQHSQQPLVGEPVDPEETEDMDICPLCEGVWVACGCDPKQADAAYTGDAA